MNKRIIGLVVGLIIVVSFGILTIGYYWGNEFVQPVDFPQGEGSSGRNDSSDETEVIVDNLEIPWEIVFLPDGDMLISQRSGSIARVSEEGKIYSIEGVAHRGEGGLLGMALHPDFENNRQIYLYMTTRAGIGLENRVVRYRLDEDTLTHEQVILDGIPGAIYHDGGRIAFSPDGYLFITTGDARNSDLAQDKNSLAGKILRLNEDGSIPEDNPFHNEVYSYGHRNPQGLAWDDEGRLWATEHGSSAYDELNVIEAGKNYGWPEIRGDATRKDMETPKVHSGRNTWAPGGAVYFKNSIIFAGLRGSSIYQARLDGADVTNTEQHFENQWGRIRAITIGPDQDVYVTTSNTDGRGRTREGDDKVIQIKGSFFE